MLTKKDFAEMIINKFCEDEFMERPSNIGDLARHIGKSSSLAVALEYLQVLSPTNGDLQYAQSRSGILMTGKNFNNEFISLSTRAVLDSLPE